MTLDQFIHQYDHAGVTILLEGKRKVREQDKVKLARLGNLLASKTKKMIFRSGNAAGADYYFSVGMVSVDRSRLQVIIPYSGHRSRQNLAYESISLDDINMAAEPEVVYESRQNKKMQKMIDQYISGVKNRNSIKAAYILRDTVKVTGTKKVKPATFGIFYDDLDNPKKGGTGHTIEVCERNNIPVIDQEVWFKWIDDLAVDKKMNFNV